MKYLGIDYGGRRVGIALSDEGGQLAFPREILQNEKELVEKIAKLCVTEKVGAIVLGESRNYDGGENPVMKKIHVFKKELEEKTKLPVSFEPEFMSSMEALHIQGEGRMHDASAATIILQSFLDKQMT